MENGSNPVTINPPRGFFPTKVDDKGRLKLTSNFLWYLGGLQAKELFATSLDRSVAKLYSIPVWNRNVALLENCGEKRTWGKDVLFLANELGGDGELDNQGRILLPTNLRRLLKLENTTVWLEAFEGGINVYSQEVFEAKQKKAQENLAEKLEYMENLGLK